jgi:hypothetical protein
MTRIALAALVVLAVASAAAAGDGVVLTDGTRLSGRVVEAGDARVVIRIDDREFAVPRSLVARIDGAPPAAADDGPPDLVYLADGGIVGGRIAGGDDGTLVVLVAGEEHRVPRTDVVRIQRGVLTPAQRRLAEAAIAKAATGDEPVRAAAVRALRSLGPAAWPLVREAIRDPGLSEEARLALGSVFNTGRRGSASPAPNDAERILSFLARRLELSAEQAAKVRALLAAAPRGGIAAESVRNGMKEILTDVQLAKFEELLKSRAGR